MRGYVYILQSATGRFYIGSTRNVEKRIIHHRSGSTQTTKGMKDFQLVFQQEYPTIQDAIRIERKLKNLKRKDYLEKIIKDGYIKMRP